MKLSEFLNDDTCQILLAIIIGIVVCYFIFGSCGSCSTGSCNRDGFSVGGPCVGSGGLPNPGCGFYLSNVACNAIPNCEWDSGEDPNQISNTGYCTDWHDNDPQGGCGDRSNRKTDYFTRNCNNGPGGNCNSTYCCINPPAAPPPPPANSGQMERDCEAYLATLSSDRGFPCEGVTLGNVGEGGESGLDSTASCCDAVESTGGCDKDTLQPELRTLIDEEIELCRNPSTNPRQRPLPPRIIAPIGTPDTVTITDPQLPANSPAPPQNKYFNILGDMISATQNLAVPPLSWSETAELDNIQTQRQSTPQESTTKANFEEVNRIAATHGIFFHICLNGADVYTGDSIIGKNLVHGDTRNMEILNMDIVNPDGLEGEPQTLLFGNLFATFATSPIEVKKDTYCSENKITISDTTNPNGTPIEKYDPLLKIKSPNMTNTNNQNYVNCSGGTGTMFPNTCDGSATATPNQEPNRECDFFIRTNNDNESFYSILQRLVSDEQDMTRRLIKHRYLNWYLSTQVSLPNNTSPRNNNEIFVNDLNLSSNDMFTTPLSQDIIVKIHNLGEETDVGVNAAFSTIYSRLKFNSQGKASDTGTDELEYHLHSASLKKLELVYGMSQPSNGRIYNSVSVTPTPDTNKYNFFKNLIFVQYLLTRLFLIGTDKYVPHELNIYSKKPEFPLKALSSREDVLASYLDNEDNTMCTNSEKDYLLLVFRDSSADSAGVPTPEQLAQYIASRPTRTPTPDLNTCLQGVYDCDRINDRMLNDPKLPNTCNRYYNIDTSKQCEGEILFSQCDNGNTPATNTNPAEDCSPGGRR